MDHAVLAAGTICLDITPQFTSGELPGPGRLTLVGPATVSPGGAVSNTGLGLHRLGVPTRLCAKVGDDSFGRIVLELLEAQAPGIGAGVMASLGEVTSYSVVLSPVGKDRAFLHCPGANHTFSNVDVPSQLLAEADLLHFGYPPVMRRMFSQGGRELEELFRRAKAAGLTTSLDLCAIDPEGESGQVDWQEILDATLPFVDLFLPSADDLRPIWKGTVPRPRGGRRSGLSALPALADWALAGGARVVVLKASTQGIYLRTGKRAGQGWAERGGPRDPAAWECREMWVPPFVPQQVATTTGAGDAAVAGFLAALLKGSGPALALVMAAAAGACAVEQPGPTSGILGWSEILERVRSGWKQSASEPSSSDWAYDAKARVWLGPRDGR